jgi:DNA-binding MarR family transcriptional regulator
MEVFVLTQAGREMIPSLHKAGREEEAKILEFLGLIDGASVNQVADEFNIDESKVYDTLRSMCANRWVWRKKTKLTEF